MSLLLKKRPLLFPPCRHQRRSCLETWKKVLPLLSSWSFWATRLSFTTLKGSDGFRLNSVGSAADFKSRCRTPPPVYHSPTYWSELALKQSLKKKRFGESWYLQCCWHCDWVGRRSALGIRSMMDERGRTGSTLSCSPPNTALFASPLSSSWLLTSVLVLPLLDFLLLSLSFFFPSLYFFLPVPLKPSLSSAPDFGVGWTSLTGKRGQNPSTQVSIIRRLCSMCPPSCLTRRETHSR